EPVKCLGRLQDRRGWRIDREPHLAHYSSLSWRCVLPLGGAEPSAPGREPVLDARPDLALRGAARHDPGVAEVFREALGSPAQRPLLVLPPEGLEEPPASRGWR